MGNKDYISLEPGQVLFKEGTWGGVLYQIVEGQVEIFKQDKYGKDVVLNTMTPGEIIGLTSFLTSSSRLASVRAKTDLKLKIIDSQKLELLRASTPKWMTTIFKDMLLRIEQMNGQYIDYLSKTGSSGLPTRNEFMLAATQISSSGRFIKENLKEEVHGMLCISRTKLTSLIKRIYFLNESVIATLLQVFIDAELLKEYKTDSSSENCYISCDELQSLKKLSFILQRVVNNRSKLVTFQTLAKLMQKFTKRLGARGGNNYKAFKKKSISLKVLTEEFSGDIKGDVIKEIVENLSSYGILRMVRIKETEYIEYGETDLLNFSRYYFVFMQLIKLDADDSSVQQVA